MNPKLQKTEKDIERTMAKIAELQGLLPNLERQRTELENLDIIKTVRGANITPGELTAFIAAYRAGLNRQAAPPPLPANDDAAANRPKEGDFENESD